jgi:hypothetical protein
MTFSCPGHWGFADGGSLVTEMAGPTAMTAINIQMVFLDRCRNNGRSRVDDFVPADRKQNPNVQSIRQQQTNP